ncbi:hypothetical protein Tco_0692376 [Tanacetum coccineum]
MERYMENYKNVSQDIRDQLNAEAEAVQIILTGIDNDIYSTVDACPNACEMWKAIERLKQGESINVQDLETNELVRNQCHITNHQVNVQFLLQLQPEWLNEPCPKSITSQDKEDPSWSTSIKTRRQRRHLQHWKRLGYEVDNLKSQMETQKTQFLNEIDRLSREYYYADHMNAILGIYTDLDEFTDLQCDYGETLEKCERLEKELSKSKTMSKNFESLQKHAINLELDLQHCKEKIKQDKSFKENQSNVILKEREQYFEIQDLKAQLQDKGIAISELKKLIEKMKGKSVETKFEKSSVIRQPNAFKSQRQSILVTAQILPQNMLPIVKNTNVIAPGMYKVHTKPNQTRTPQLHQDIRKPNKRVSFSTGVIPNTSVSRPQLKSNHLEDRVMSNNSQGKKQEVEDHRRKKRKEV